MVSLVRWVPAPRIGCCQPSTLPAIQWDLRFRGVLVFLYRDVRFHVNRRETKEAHLQAAKKAPSVDAMLDSTLPSGDGGQGLRGLRLREGRPELPGVRPRDFGLRRQPEILGPNTLGLFMYICPKNEALVFKALVYGSSPL